MKANIKIEAIGNGNDQANKLWSNVLDGMVFGLGDVIRMPKRYWVAEITGTHPVYKLDRKFLNGKVDYKDSSSTANRGVFYNYVLESGKIYEVSKPTSWKSTHRFFAIVSNSGEIEEYRSYDDAKATIE